MEGDSVSLTREWYKSHNRTLWPQARMSTMLLIKATDYRKGGTETVNTLVRPLFGRSCRRSSLTSVPRDKRAYGQCADGRAGWLRPCSRGQLRDPPCTHRDPTLGASLAEFLAIFHPCPTL